jgi:hypothetical protein
VKKREKQRQPLTMAGKGPSGMFSVMIFSVSDPNEMYLSARERKRRRGVVAKGCG